MATKRKNVLPSKDEGFAPVGSNNIFNGNYPGGIGASPGTGLVLGGTSTNQANYGNLLDFLGSIGYKDGNLLSVILSALGINTGDMSEGQAVDWNKLLLDNQLALLSEQEKRKYNEGIRDEQRLYDNPQNVLARLMGAGISRDAAIQMLSGAGGSGSGGLVTGDAAAFNAGIPASQSALNEQQTKSIPFQTMFGAISALSGLVSLGISIPQAVVNVTAMGIQNALSKKALVGLQSADAVMTAFSNALETGALTTEQIDGFSNGTDALNYAFKNKDNSEFQEIFANGSFAQVYGTKLGRDMFSQLWKSVRASKDDGTILDNYIQNQRLQNALAGLEAEQIGAEISKIGTETKVLEQNIVESLARVAEINANIQVLNKQGEWIDVQTKYQPKVWGAEIENLSAQSEALHVQTDYNRDLFEINHAGVPILKQKFIDECEFAAYHAATLNSKELRDKYWASWYNNADNAVAASYLQLLYNNGVGDFATEHPHLWKLCMGMSYSGGFDGVRAGAEVTGAAGAAAGGVGTLIKATKYVPKVP